MVHGWMVNAETAIYRAGTFENITVGYSAHNGWDVALSLINTQILGPNKLFQGEVFLNVAKTFILNPKWTITLGSQNGVALANQQPRLCYHFDFIDTHYELTSWLALHVGSYLGNKALTGTVQQVGFITGTEITFIPNSLALQMDYTSGHQALSGATVNMVLNINPYWQLYMGVYVPEQHSGNEFAGLMGFNILTKSF